MTTTIISFLGRSDKQAGGYRKTRYIFNGQPDEPSSFFGYNLRKRITPSRMVVLGTSGSMWDHLFERDTVLGDEMEDERLELMEAVSNKHVMQQQLDSLQPLLSKYLNCEVILKVIPYCRLEEEQIELIRIISDHVEEGGGVHLDITHGFRTLPMITLISALYLREVRKAQIEGIWYGAYDSDTGEAPVQNLSGLLHIADWLGALNSYSKDGDYSVFSALMGDGGQSLAQAAFYERIGNISNAREKISTWTINDGAPNSAPMQLFKDELEQRLNWHKAGMRPDYEARLACEYLNRGDYIRAALFGLESRISREVYKNKERDDYESRENYRGYLRENKAFDELNRIRNAMAHGLRSENKRIAKWLESEKVLKKKMQDLFTELNIR